MFDWKGSISVCRQVHFSLGCTLFCLKKRIFVIFYSLYEVRWNFKYFNKKLTLQKLNFRYWFAHEINLLLFKLKWKPIYCLQQCFMPAVRTISYILRCKLSSGFLFTISRPTGWKIVPLNDVLWLWRVKYFFLFLVLFKSP